MTTENVAASMLDQIIGQKLQTSQGRKTVASYMATYLRDVATYGRDLNTSNHRLMLQRASEILKALSESIPNEEKREHT